VYTADPSRRTSGSLRDRPISAPERPWERASDEHGFSFVELLVTILIIAILAAIAIPSLLGQKSKAYDASAKELAHTAQMTAETIATDNNGEYKFKLPSELKAIESTLNTTNTNEAELIEAKEIEGGKGYEIVTKAASTGDKFTISRSATGGLTRTCNSGPSKTGCSGGATGSW
jgi:type IV pilus assembly protein PilA